MKEIGFDKVMMLLHETGPLFLKLKCRSVNSVCIHSCVNRKYFDSGKSEISTYILQHNHKKPY